jgi:hypothetical protein
MAADDTGDDITIGENNIATDGTKLTMAPDDDGNVALDTAVLTVGTNINLAQVPDALLHGVDGIRVHGFAKGSGLVADVEEGGGTAIVGLGNSVKNPGVLGTNALGTGVIGRSEASNSPEAIGVLGQCDFGTGVKGESQLVGVEGRSPGGAGVVGTSGFGPGVKALSGESTAIFALSIKSRGAIFSSGTGQPTPGEFAQTTHGGIAQVRLVPSDERKLPSLGFVGDLYLYWVKPAVGNDPGEVNLYLCVNHSPVQWQQVQLGPRLPGGMDAP